MAEAEIPCGITGRALQRGHPNDVRRLHPARPAASGARPGLGLYVAREIVTAHGGEIEATSSLGKGRCMTVRLPLADRRAESGTPAMRRSPAKSGASPKRISPARRSAPTERSPK